MKVTVKNSEYIWTHGMNPRGDGAWMFEIGKDWFTFHGNFGFAKKEAQKIAMSLGLTEVKVLP